jgi:hypothetical protein
MRDIRVIDVVGLPFSADRNRHENVKMKREDGILEVALHIPILLGRFVN